MKWEELRKVLDKNTSLSLARGTIRKITIEQGDTLCAIQIVFNESTKDGVPDLCLFEKINDTEVLDYEERGDINE